jgi:hypothetical protein
MQLSGRQLFVRITLRGGWISIYASAMDEGDEPSCFSGRRRSCRLDDDTALSSGFRTIWN